MSPPGDDGHGEPGSALVLVIEHEAAVAELARRYLERDGLTVRVAGTLGEAAAALRTGLPAVVVLDLTMPGLTPGVVRRRLPVRGLGTATELICLEGPGGLRPRHVGIAGEGEARCIARPFSPRILAARVRAAVRQPFASTPHAGTCALGALIVDAQARRASVAGADVCLTATEFDLLALLAGNAGRVLSRQQLLGAVRRPGAAAGVRSVDVHVAALRAKLGTHSPIRTVRGVGYVAEACGNRDSGS